MTTTNITKNIFEDMAESGKWEASYGKSKFHSYNFITRRDSVASLLEKDKYKKTLDLGCGTGDFVSLLYPKTSSYIGVDFVPAMAIRGRQRFINHGNKINFLAADASSLPFQADSFDSIIAIGFIEYFDDPDSILKEISRVLKKGGTLVIQSYKMDFYWLCAHFCGLIYLRKLLISIYHRLKGSRKKLFSVDRPHKKKELDTMLSRHGFDVIDYRFDNYFLLPRTISKLFPNVYVRLSELIDKKSRIFNFFAVNYVAKCSLRGGTNCRY